MINKRSFIALCTAVAGISFFSIGASAQVRIDTSGHALDANTQVGSAGYNYNPVNPVQNYQYQNGLLTNNTAGGYGFRGANFHGVNLGVGYSDPFAFRGLLAGEGVDQFISISAGVPTMANPTASSENFAAPPNPSLTYYGQSNHVNAPPGTVPISNNLGYTSQQPLQYNPQDTRVGAIDYSGQSQVIPKPYEMILPGPVDTSANPATSAQQMLAVNPLFGVVNWTLTPTLNVPGQNITNNTFGSTPLQQGLTPQVDQGLTQSQIRNLREEIASQSPNGIGSQVNLNNGASPLQPMRPGMDTSANAQQPLTSGLSQSNQLTPANLAPMAGDVSTDQSTRQQLDTELPPPAPGQQSAEYAKLRKSLEDYNSAHNLTDEQANQRFQDILKLRDMAARNAENGGNVLSSPQNGSVPSGNGAMNPSGIPNPEEVPTLQPSPNLGSGGTPAAHHGLKPSFEGGSSIAPPVENNPIPAPEVNNIDSFASGIHAQGLANIIAGAELAVQKQQYDKAIRLYGQAVDVVPNNPLILEARATAELAGGYYSQANADLHIAIAEDPAILMSKYDLQQHLGEQRLKDMTRDLKAIATDKKDDTLHSFLLTYVYYNSHHINQAAQWLHTADQRANGQDPALVQMKKYWNFNDEAPLPPPEQPSAKPAPPTTQPTLTK